MQSFRIWLLIEFFFQYLPVNNVQYLIILLLLACTLSSLALAILSFLASDAKVCSVLMFILIGFANGAITGGPGVNHIDMSPRYAGIIIAITNTSSNIFAIIGPLVVQIFVTDEVSRDKIIKFKRNFRFCTSKVNNCGHRPRIW